MQCPNCHVHLKVVNGRLIRHVPDVNVQMFRVESSFIRAVGYEPKSETLKIEMSNGTYLYEGVPLWQFAGLLGSESKGRYFNDFISNTYAFSRL